MRRPGDDTGFSFANRSTGLALRFVRHKSGGIVRRGGGFGLGPRSALAGLRLAALEVFPRRRPRPRGAHFGAPLAPRLVWSGARHGYRIGFGCAGRKPGPDGSTSFK